MVMMVVALLVLVMAVGLFVFAQIAAIAICVLGTMGSKAVRRSAPRKMVRRWVREREARKEECPPPPPNFE